ncbi:MAG TPA: sodium:alanine symporter family protein [Thermoanaerobaculia bacterium]|nr:sodium:alanine symporter family protein [Thermoanaerobaculia bacterium]HUM29946.1 sodium:alanine symporter family protein [Thermoanaerobaculia bacterium]HXK68187.1 sodium:alanine symporter family protein [Thermoanaerobaculia bacterium]
MDLLVTILERINNMILWGPPMLILLVGTGIYLSFRLQFIQIRGLFKALHMALIERKEKSGDASGDISHFQALMTALSATVGTGNIAGVATAVSAGGPGALFWMWITGFFGMATKYSEAVLAVKYRETDAFGTMSGGPMYYLEKGLKAPFLGILFAIFASISAFGIGNMVQSHEVAKAVQDTFGMPTIYTGLILAAATALVILGGIRSIGKTTSVLVPIMIVVYFLGCMAVLVLHWKEIPSIFLLVLESAFSPRAATGGVIGYSVKEAIRFGVARGVFSNESGLGSSPIAAAAAKTSNPVNQALVSMTQTFIDTIVVCSLTGFTILVTQAYLKPELSGSEITNFAFETALPGLIGRFIVSSGLILFAYSTLLGWSYYGEKAIEYLFRERAVMPYRILFCVAVFFGAAFAKVDFVWQFADSMNALMALPNLLGLVILSNVIVRETRTYYGGGEKTRRISP